MGNLEYPTWMSYGLSLLNGILNDQMKLLRPDGLVEFFEIRTNLLEYGTIRFKIHTSLRKLGILNTQENGKLDPHLLMALSIWIQRE